MTLFRGTTPDVVRSLRILNEHVWIRLRSWACTDAGRSPQRFRI